MIIRGQKRKNIFFHGNSLCALGGASNTTANGRYLETTLYNLIIAQRTGYVATFLSLSGNPTRTKIADWATQVLPTAKPGDWLFHWEITNNVNVNNLTGAEDYADNLTLLGLARAAGMKVAFGTAIPRDHVADTTQNSRNMDSNVLARANQSNWDLFIDFNSVPGFQTQADCSNTTYYQADKLHETIAGADVLAAFAAQRFLTVL